MLERTGTHFDGRTGAASGTNRRKGKTCLWRKEGTGHRMGNDRPNALYFSGASVHKLTMKYFVIVIAAIFIGACNTAAPISQGPELPAENRTTNGGNRLESVAAHTTENENPTMSKKPERHGPVGEPIDTTEFDAAIKAATKEMAASPKSTEAKEKLGGAYFSR